MFTQIFNSLNIMSNINKHSILGQTSMIEPLEVGLWEYWSKNDYSSERHRVIRAHQDTLDDNS